ncbi:MAG: redoxin domain-containing protein [candidate division Zixibacteria bacterium]|nr:redoxin domain-containing protein [candidate division Zixibacteria bacterium]
MGSKRWRRNVSFAVILVLVIIIAYFGGLKAAQGVQGWKARQEQAKRTESILKEMGTGLGVGRSLPDAVLADLEGVETRLSGLLCDRTVVVFFRTDCSFSQAELAALQAATVTPADQSCFVLISNSDQIELWDVKQKLGLSCSILYDRDTKYGKQLGVKSVPLNFIVDRTLKIEDVISGTMPTRDIRDFMGDNRKKYEKRTGILPE